MNLIDFNSRCGAFCRFVVAWRCVALCGTVWHFVALCGMGDNVKRFVHVCGVHMGPGA